MESANFHKDIDDCFKFYLDKAGTSVSRNKFDVGKDVLLVKTTAAKNVRQPSEVSVVVEAIPESKHAGTRFDSVVGSAVAVVDLIFAIDIGAAAKPAVCLKTKCYVKDVAFGDAGVGSFFNAG